MTKNTFYRDLYIQVEALISDEADVIANMANVSALLFEQLTEVNWVGFYRMVNDELVLGPFQGKVACIRIPLVVVFVVQQQVRIKYNVLLMYMNLMATLLVMLALIQK